MFKHDSCLVDQLVLDDILDEKPGQAEKKATEKLILKKEQKVTEMEHLEPSLGPHGWKIKTLKRKRFSVETLELDNAEELARTPKLEKVKNIVPAGRTTTPKIWTKLRSGLYGWKNPPKQRAELTLTSMKSNTEAANSKKN